MVGPGAKVFETYFCETFLESGDAVLVFQPAFPTFEPNIARRGAVPVYAPVDQAPCRAPRRYRILRCHVVFDAAGSADGPGRRAYSAGPYSATAIRESALRTKP